MAEQNLTPEIKSALVEFQRYLSDELAPLMVVDSIEKVLRLSPNVVAEQIQTWIGGQVRGPGADIPVSDYLFHAVKKIHHFTELDLIPEEKINTYLGELKTPLVALCPPEDREFLENNLRLIGEAGSGVQGGVEYVYRQPGSESKLATKTETGSREEIQKRLSLVVERLSRMPMGTASAAAGGNVSSMPVARRRVISEAVSAAASLANSGQELDQNLDQIRDAGVDVDPRLLFRYLGNSLPEWSVPVKEAVIEDDESFPSSEGHPIDAMKRLLTLSEDPQEKAHRYRQFVEAAIEQFNDGAIGRAVTMLGLAEGIQESGDIPTDEAQRISKSAEEHLDPARLRGSAETPETHYLLRKLLNFFPGMRPEGILDSLMEEERRDRRRLLLALIEVFGSDARQAALEKFEAHDNEQLASSDPFFARNLLYVLNRIPGSGQASDQELRIAEQLSAPRYRPLLTKEAIATLGQTDHPRAVSILVRRLSEYESLLTADVKPPHPPAEIRKILDRAVAALERIGTPEALSAVVDHGLSESEELGDTLRRLSALGNQDLSESPAIVQRLIAAVQERLPKKFLGMVMRKQSAEEAEKLLDALAGTGSPEVIELLESIRQKFPDLEIAEKAQTIMESAGVKASAATVTTPKLSGDLELFGLPNLIQNLASNDLTGVLSIMDRSGNRVGAVSFDGGRIVRCHAGDLRGREAFFQLFESAEPGTFSFVERIDASHEETDTAPMDVTPLILEALRRFDELRSARAIVPPEVPLEATAVKPVHDPRETDPKVIREVWLKAASGVPPAEWEGQIPVDSYRIWRLLVHWVQNDALTLKE